MTLGDTEVVGELVLARDQIETEIGMKPLSFASPYGDYDERVLANIKRYHRSHFTAWGGYRGVNMSQFDEYEIERVNIDESLTSDEVCNMVLMVQEGE